MAKKRIPVGYEDIKQIVDEDLYYIDKTLMIRELLEHRGKVNLLTRPRRFGKTLNLSMLRRFFEDERTEVGESIDNRYIFDNLAVSRCGEPYLRHQQQYPVISLTLKSAAQPDYKMAYASVVDDITKEFQRHVYVLQGNLPQQDLKRYQEILLGEAEPIVYAKALQFLSQCLSRYHGKKVIILIDEYDVPLEKSFFKEYYEQMVDFIRSLFESALKTNDSLEFAVVTGCLRISRESIFTGLNNLEIHSMLSYRYADCFGFTEAEVIAMLAYYGLSDKLPELKEWYDGYRIGEMEIYNPWSIINYVKERDAERDGFPKPYWSNTSSNSIVKELVERADQEVREELELLIAKEAIEKPVHEDITYGDVFKSRDNLWNFLFFTGYLKEVSRRFEEEMIYITMAVPNAEIRYIYRNTIREWFDQRIRGMDLSGLYRSLCSQETDEVQEFLRQQLRKTISYYDSNEAFYHGFLLGLLQPISGYGIKSNRENGNGRPDILLIPLDEREPVLILELKRADKLREMEAGAKAALTQIINRNYAAEYLEEGYENILGYGICFCKKSCVVKGQRISGRNQD